MVMLLLTSGDAQYLLVATEDSYNESGAYKSKLISREVLRRLDVVRLYEQTTTAFWEKMKKEILEGKIAIGRVHA